VVHPPPDIMERAREALGGIDLDPATHPIAQQTIGAATFYTAADNGLDRPWFGRVWLNPPFNRTLLSLFVEKLSRFRGCSQRMGGVIPSLR
jgi:hypothetical protein